MENLDLLGFLIITLNCNVTIVGKIWLLCTVLLRMGVTVLAGYPIYQDEQERFVCNTLQPGCANVCYDSFSPVSQLRFWLAQGVAVLLPHALFSVYVLHKGAQRAARRACLTVPDFSCAYLVHLCFRTLVEAALGAWQYLLFGLSVPKRFSCTHPPCSSVVECYVSRPTEKSVLTLFSWALSVLSLVLSLADLVCSLRRRMSRGRGPRQRASPPGLAQGSKPSEGEGQGRWGAEAVPSLSDGGLGGPRARSAMSGQVVLLDEGASEGLSSASDKVPTAHGWPAGGCPREASRDPGNEGLTQPEARRSASRSHLGGRCPSGRLHPPEPPGPCGGGPHPRTKKSEWV